MCGKINLFYLPILRAGCFSWCTYTFVYPHTQSFTTAIVACSMNNMLCGGGLGMWHGNELLLLVCGTAENGSKGIGMAASQVLSF